MKFSEVIGQQELRARMLRMVSGGRLPHALLLSGSPGYGGLPFALALSQYLCCEDRGESDSCGSCPSCLKYEKLIHPDLHFIFPVNKAKKISAKEPLFDDALSLWREQLLANPYLTLDQWYEAIGLETKQGFISTAESKQIIRKLSLKTYESAYKVVVIWYPEKMNHQAANRILKILEEPPAGTHFILVAESTDSLLTTVKSRTQLIVLPPVEQGSLKQVLSSRFSLAGELLDEVVRLSRGDYNRSLELISQGEEDRVSLEQFIRFMRLVYRPKLIELLEWVNEISGTNREKQKSFLSYCLRMIRENYLLNTIPGKKDSLVYMNREEEEFSQKFSVFIHSGNLEPITREINEAIRHIEANGYARTIFFDLGLKLMRLIHMEN